MLLSGNVVRKHYNTHSDILFIIATIITDNIISHNSSYCLRVLCIIEITKFPCHYAVMNSNQIFNHGI